VTAFPPMSAGQMRHVAPHRGAMVLTLGILGLIICAACGVFALVMGKNDMREMDAGRMDPSGRGLTQAGWILGIIGTVILGIQLLVILLYLVIIVFFVGMMGVAAASGAGGPTPGGGSSTSSPSGGR